MAAYRQPRRRFYSLNRRIKLFAPGVITKSDRGQEIESVPSPAKVVWAERIDGKRFTADFEEGHVELSAETTIWIIRRFRSVRNIDLDWRLVDETGKRWRIVSVKEEGSAKLFWRIHAQEVVGI